MKESFLCIIILMCSIGCYNNLKSQNKYVGKINDTIYFNQKCINTIYLPIYKPTETGEEVFDKVINTKHQDLLKYPNGTFEVSEEVRTDTTITILYIDKGIKFFSQYGWNSFRGVIYFKGHTFLIRRNVSNNCVDTLLKETGLTEGFNEYSDKIYEKVDEKIEWKFTKRAKKFNYSYTYPPSSILDFEIDTVE